MSVMRDLMDGIDAPHDEKYFSEMLVKIRSELIPKIPSTDEGKDKLLQSTILSVSMAQSTRNACKEAQDKASTDEEAKAASDALAAAEEALAQATQVAIEVSRPILQDLEESLLDNDTLDSLLVKCCILTNASRQLVDFCGKGEEESKLIDDLLKNDDLMRKMLFNGGAKGENYGQALRLYNSLVASLDKNSDEILYRLALGTSLELAVPMNEFDTDVSVDVVQRFGHYEQAYSNGELDLAFQNRSTWECRFITNCEAPNEQLAWGRRMLRNYRPDLVEMQDYKWRYVEIVRTDVHYCKPTWTSSPRTYQQMISGGGECGPRAWFGRFALKMFGIPTWGVRQPGHAALGHWTPNDGWVMCLGAAWKFSTWEDREGEDFVLEAQARGQSEDYMGVCRLDWVADAVGESPIKGKLNPDCYWRSLALLQKHHLATTSRSETDAEVERVPSNYLDSIRKNESIKHHDDGTIVVPAAACSAPTESSAKAIFMKSFLGGMQLHIRDDQSLVYNVTLHESRRYQLTIRLVTVHLKTHPILLTVTNTSICEEGGVNDDLVMVSSISVPYTVGEWKITDPIDVELEQGTNVICLSRETPNFGLSMKELILKPSDSTFAT